MKNNKLCIIGVYFGTLPQYFNLWLKSAEANNKIDFLIFTDNSITVQADNVLIIPMSLQNMKLLAEEKLQMQISLEDPYKCCDFKVAYGIIFKDYINDYEYWAHCDFDMIFGDIYGFLEKYNYNKYDKFLNLGHLSFYRNSDVVNERYKEDGSECGDYRQVFTNKRFYAFDEWRGINKIYEKNNYPKFEERIFADISSIYYRYRLALQDKNYNYQIFYWQDGHIYRSFFNGEASGQEEFMYIHMKKRPDFDAPKESIYWDGFYITNRGFFEKKEKTITKKTIKEYNRFPGKLYELIELSIFNSKNIKKKVAFRMKRYIKVENGEG